MMKNGDSCHTILCAKEIFLSTSSCLSLLTPRTFADAAIQNILARTLNSSNTYNQSENRQIILTLICGNSLNISGCKRVLSEILGGFPLKLMKVLTVVLSDLEGLSG